MKEKIHQITETSLNNAMLSRFPVTDYVFTVDNYNIPPRRADSIYDYY